MKKVILSALFFLSLLPVAAQEHLEDVVYLNNGGIVRGLIIEQVPGQSLKIQTRDGSVFFYPLVEVSKIAKEPPFRGRYAGGADFQIRPKFKTFVELGYQSSNQYEAQVSMGAQLLPFVYTGAGLGAFWAPDEEELAIPVFANVRFTLPLQVAVRPYLDVRAGYGALIDSQRSGGFYGSLTVGVEMGRFYLGCGYSSQSVSGSVYVPAWKVMVNGSGELDGFALRAGVKF